MSKIDVVAQAPYSYPISTGRHLLPGEIARKIECTPEIENSLTMGFLREITPLESTPRKPRAEIIARDDNQESQ